MFASSVGKAANAGAERERGLSPDTAAGKAQEAFRKYLRTRSMGMGSPCSDAYKLISAAPKNE
jgi:hypothetical protein